MTITIASLTANVATDSSHIVTGDGVFDDLMETVNSHLDAQFKLGRITGSDYANVYLGAMQAALQQSVAFTLGMDKANAEVALLGQKEITEYAQTLQTTKTAPDASSVAGKQITLFDQQAKGFLWNAKNKHLKTIMDAWSINISTAGVAATGVTAINETGTGNINTQITNAEPTDE